MLRAALFTLLALVPVHTFARHGKYSAVLLNDNEWDVSKAPHPDTTDHLVFETVYSLLQFWPNIRYRNGHSIVPGIVPEGTLLYHITSQEEVPPGPEWVALDQEHSYNFCGFDSTAPGDPHRGCIQLIFANTRPLKIVYFDGKSAAKITDGPLDTQDLLAWGGLRHEYAWEETLRIEHLCAWGRNHGVDGFVRMEVAFEVMLCDFTSNLSIVSSSKIMAIHDGKRTVFESLNAGSRHNYFPGETRIQLDLSELVSFYDTQLVPSLVAVRAEQEKWEHRAGNISTEDWLAVKSRLEGALARPFHQSSGIEWRTLFQVIVDRFARRLELVRHLLDSLATSSDGILDLANKAQAQLRIMLAPYILLSITPENTSTNLDWSTPIYKLCATTHTKFSESELNSMTASEKLLLQAVRGTSREICRIVTKMWVAGVNAGVDQSLNTERSPDLAEVTQVWSAWTEDLNGLMTWLDWSVWIKCNPGCGPEEVCQLHRWPPNFPDPPESGLRAVSVEHLTEGVWGTIKPEPRRPYNSQPSCVSLIDP